MDNEDEKFFYITKWVITGSIILKIPREKTEIQADGSLKFESSPICIPTSQWFYTLLMAQEAANRMKQDYALQLLEELKGLEERIVVVQEHR